MRARLDLAATCARPRLPLVRAEVADLDRDGSPEIYVYLKSTAAGSHGSLLAFSANRRKSLSDIFLAPLTDRNKAARGYRGQDEFAVVEHRLSTPGSEPRSGRPRCNSPAPVGACGSKAGLATRLDAASTSPR